MKSLTLVPAYGRDYKTKAAVEADLRAGKDFLVQDISAGRDDGRYANLEDLKTGGYGEVRIRYKRLTQVTIIKL